ncbi:MAG: zinc-ribbon domain-containing protein [Anaerolineales bacterium]|nr:zinc-ribbon domain-containing protein [Anaerolineales bacterium]
MKNEPAVSAAGQDASTASSALSPGVRTAGVRPCPSCGATVSVHATVCPECGESLDARSRRIRCRRCHQNASAELVVCPHCGRELQPAASRWLTVGLPVFAVLLLAGLLLLRAGGSCELVAA